MHKDDQYLRAQIMLLVSRFGYLRVAQALAPFKDQEPSLEEIEGQIIRANRPAKGRVPGKKTKESDDALKILSDAILRRKSS